MAELRNDWALEEVAQICGLPLEQLVSRASEVHKEFHNPKEIQACTLLSIKTGACPEDCKYCAQSARYKTGLKTETLLEVCLVLERARIAKANGATRFCMGAAWRDIPQNGVFDEVLKMVRGARDLGLEVCGSLGMMTECQAFRLKDAGLYAYNHNLDTSESFYRNIITTRTYADRMRTIEFARRAGMTVCCGGILGLGESGSDRVSLLHALATMKKHPESVPINALVPIDGTPLSANRRVTVFEMARAIAAARILMPASMVRLAAGRLQMNFDEQALCFRAGANSIFLGDKLLTTPNPPHDRDLDMIRSLGLTLKKHVS